MIEEFHYHSLQFSNLSKENNLNWLLDSSHMHIARSLSFPLCCWLDTDVLSVTENWINGRLSVWVLCWVLVEIICRALQVCTDWVVDLSGQVLDTVVHSDSGSHWRCNSSEGNPEEVEIRAEGERIVSCLLESACHWVLLVPGHVKKQVWGDLEHGLSIGRDIKEFLWGSFLWQLGFKCMMMMLCWC